MSAAFKLDTSRFDRALRAFAAESRRQGTEVLKNQARLFVRDVASVTPPNRNARFLRSRGESKVRGDMAKIMRPVKLAPNDPSLVHKKARGKNGRVQGDLRGKPDLRWPVSKPRFDPYRRKKIAMVGFLAAGWMSAARKLGTKLPEWIARHGTRFGNVSIMISRTGMIIRVENAVPFVGGVSGMKRRMQWALGNRARQMQKQLADLAVKRAARKAGFKT